MRVRKSNFIIFFFFFEKITLICVIKKTHAETLLIIASKAHY